MEQQQQEENTIQIKKMLTNYKRFDDTYNYDLSLFKTKNQTKESSYNINIKTIYINLTHLNKEYKSYNRELELIESTRQFLKIIIAQYKSNIHKDYFDALKTLDEKNKRYERVCETLKECNKSIAYYLKRLQDTEDAEYLRDAKEIEDAEKTETNFIQDKNKNWWRGLFRCI